MTGPGLAITPRPLRRRRHEAGYRWPRDVDVARAAHLPQTKGGSPDL
jgi:hypothetical protein